MILFSFVPFLHVLYINCFDINHTSISLYAKAHMLWSSNMEVIIKYLIGKDFNDENNKQINIDDRSI